MYSAGSWGAPLRRFVDAVFAEEFARPLVEQVGFGGQQAPAEPLVVAVLGGARRSECGMGVVDGGAGERLEEPALGVQVGAGRVAGLERRVFCRRIHRCSSRRVSRGLKRVRRRA